MADSLGGYTRIIDKLNKQAIAPNQLGSPADLSSFSKAMQTIQEQQAGVAKALSLSSFAALNTDLLKATRHLHELSTQISTGFGAIEHVHDTWTLGPNAIEEHPAH